MNKSASITVMAAWFFMAVALTGCGGHGNSDGDGASSSEDTLCTANGRIVLPEGSALAMSDLTVIGCIDSVTPGSTGSFAVEEPDSGPALVMVKDKDGHAVLMGFVDGVDTTVADISAKSTATALLFQQLCAYTIMPSAWKDALAVIAADSHTDTLAGVIATRLAADPAALESEDSEIRAALVAAAEAVLPVAMRSTSESDTSDDDETSSASVSSSQAVTMVTIEKDVSLAQSVAAITVTSESTQSGIQVGAYADGDGVILTNTYRRHVWYYVYITGYQDENGKDTNYSLNSWVEVTNGYLSSTNGLAGALGSSIDALWGNVAYKAVSTAPIEITFEPSTAKKMYLAVITAGAGSKSLALPSEIEGSPNASAWAAGKSGMQAVTLVKDFVLPAVFTFVPANAVGRLSGKQLTDLSWEIIGACTQAGFDASTSIASNDWWGAFKTIVKGVASDENLREALGKVIATRILAKYASTETAVLIGNSAALLMKVLKVIDYAYLGIDCVAVVKDCANSDAYNYFTYTGSKPTVRIEPDPASVSPGDSVDLTTYKDIADSGSYTYTYKIAGNHGTLIAGTQSGTDIETTSETVTYLCDLDAQAGDTETVEVTVERWITTDSGTRMDLIGEASVTITVDASTAYDAAADFSLAANPNGAWSYGQTASLGGQLSLYSTNMIDSLGMYVWYGSTDNYTPSVAKNATGQALYNSTHSITWPAGALSFHPSRYNDKSVVRWTAPTAGTCAIEASFTLLDAQASDVDVHVLHNGTSLMSTTISGYSGTTGFAPDAPIEVQAGDTIDFVVGYGSGSFLNDSTQLEAKITLTGE